MKDRRLARPTLIAVALIAVSVAASTTWAVIPSDALLQKLRPQGNVSDDAGILTPAFLAALGACPPSSQVFTTTLSSYNSSGTAIAISTDCTVQTVSISGATYSGQAGTTTLVTNISGVGPANFTYSTTSSPLTSWTTIVREEDPTYGVFAIGWTSSQAAPTVVPALSPFAAILLAVALCAAAIYLIRRRMAGLDMQS